MASSFDLAPRLAKLQDTGLVVESEYRGTPAAWLLSSLKECDVRVVNCKGVKLDNTIVMVKLSKLEELLAAAAPQVKDAAPVAEMAR